MQRTQTSPPHGLALVELVLAALILSILAAVVLPQLRVERGDPRSAQVSQRLQTLRRAIDLYASQNERLPDAALVRQLTRTAVGPDGISRGPYLRKGVPPSPVSGSASVRAVVLMPHQPIGGEGWIYDTTTGDIRLNARGGPSASRRWFDY